MMSLSQPVESVNVERHAGKSFRVGVAEMNGWRKSMEDAHVVHMQEDCGFFGVFDGHGGGSCSKFVARRLEKDVEEFGIPCDDETVEAWMFDVDQEFLDTSSSTSGSTGTFVIVERCTDITKRRLRVGNIGDSRVLLGQRDGTMVRGSGTDFALTIDHKPNCPSEEARIVLSGNEVINKRGCHRINGGLAVSRAFGDRKYKIPADSAPAEQCVSSQADFSTVECTQSDFVMLVCDGISEGDFPNADAVCLAAQQLRIHGDPGRAATAVCRRALMEGSTDNLTCMIVLLSGGELDNPHKEFIPGPLSAPYDLRFLIAYLAHVDAANVPVSAPLDAARPYIISRIQTLERRQRVQKQQEAAMTQTYSSLLSGKWDDVMTTIMI